MSPEEIKKRERHKKRQAIKKSIPFYLMSLPAVVYLIINNYMPLPGLVLAFKKYNAKDGIYKSKWVGLKNFKYLFKTTDAYIMTRNTILYNLVFIILGTVCAIAVAIILSELKGRQKNAYQSLILLPHMVSMVIVAYLVFGFLSAEDGYINKSILPLFGREGIMWYQEKKYWPFILVFVYIWKGIGYSSIIYLSTIMGIDRTFYEAAAIDGAGKWRQITKITIPLLKPTIVMMTILAIGRIFYSDFGLFYQVPMNQGMLFPVTQTIDTYVYRGLVQLNDITLSAATGFFQSLIGFVLIMSTNLIVRKIDPENSLF